jgi:hypothetical protein
MPLTPPVTAGYILPFARYAVAHIHGAHLQGAGNGAIWVNGKLKILHGRHMDGIATGQELRNAGLIPVVQAWEVRDGCELRWDVAAGWRYGTPAEFKAAEKAARPKPPPTPPPPADPVADALAKARASAGVPL